MLPPSPPPKQSLHHFMQLSGKNRVGYLRQLHDKYGDVVYFKVWTVDVVSVANPDFVRHILNRPDTYGKHSAIYYTLRRVLGKGLFVSEKELWVRQRKALQPYFYKTHLETLTSGMVASIEQALDDLARYATATNKPIDLILWLNRITLRLTMQALFGVSLTPLEENQLIQMVNRLLETVQHNARFPDVADRMPTFQNWQYYRDIKSLRQIAHNILERRKKRSDGAFDMISLMHQHGDIDPQQVADEVVNFILAGYETTTHAMAWAWYELFKHPEWLSPLQQTVRETLGMQLPTFESYAQLENVQHTFSESLRLHPNLPVLSRRTRLADQWTGFDIAPRTEIFINAHYLHHSPLHWETPQIFYPQRFAANNGRHPFAYLPWGGGVHKCIGFYFSQLEATMVLAMMLQRFDIACLNIPRVGELLNLTSRPTTMKVRITPAK